MANLVPGFLWTPIDVGTRAARRKGRGAIGHVAVSNSKNLIPGPLASRPSDWHFYFPKIGPARQYIDLDVQCWSSAGGNPTCPAWESEGGMGTAAQVNAEPWTHDQIVSGAMVLRHLHQTEGTPYQDMRNSLPSSRGLGVHRYGISPWRVPGGEVWSSVNGKLCPGDAKAAQVATIVDLAASGQPLTYGTGDVWTPPAVTPTVTPTPAPVPSPAHAWVPDLPAWDLPAGHWFGNKAGGATQHGGFYIGERDNIKGIQRAFIVLGCVPGVSDYRSGWADGLWETATDVACRNWFARYRPGQQYTDRVYADDYAALQRNIA